ncbi:alpha/beta fold hydrolase [Cupriavidus agavae]|uniref:Pimeloyl-ACP methyl ester carboxylesterase n=1 Tax=Cupriavidus agavae TaxID=1001822 RepID=A0A4V2FGZ0_9BURK|nr:alpha/beta fold hydrolase [Cupriavidus agavae]RZT38449.1 pimeloyl-ACP methyl ester carboxylesterase [Cupriavidus agavae]
MTRALPPEAVLQAPPGPFTRWFGQGRLGFRSLSRDTLARRYALPASRWVQVMGALVHYTDEGAPGAEPLVLIHGFGASLHTWEGLMPALRQRYRVIRLDLPPFGLTGPLRDARGRIVTMDVDAYRTFVDSFLRTLGIARATLVGNSLGGLIAWDLAARRPALVSRLVLIDAAGFPMKLPVYIGLFRHALVRWSAPWLLPEPIIRAATRDVYGDARRVPESTFRRYVDFFYAAGSRAAVGRMVPRLDFDALDTGRLRAVQAPTLVLWGERDRWIPPAHAAAFAARLPVVSLRRYADLGHVPMEEDPQRVAADLLPFLDGAPQAPVPSIQESTP